MADTKYKPIIGLEIHAELKTRTKMFCDSLNDPDEKHPNVNICPICLAHPGTLPVANEDAVKKVILTGLALNCKIEKDTFFERKNYFYPDLPKGYQISQYQKPLCYGGYLDIKSEIRNPKSETNSKSEISNPKRVRITRIHLEEDAGRLVHRSNRALMETNGKRIFEKNSVSFGEDSGASYVDFNRAGVPLMELVTEPDLESGEEVRKFSEELRLILRYLDVSDADMEKGLMRIEVNVSIRPNNDRMKANNKRMGEERSNDNRIILKDESYRLMGLFFEVHNKLGPVYKEKNYQDAVEEILKREKIPYEREKEIKLALENLEVGGFFADFVIDGQILLETKATKFITQEDIRQVLRYLKSANLPLGIIVNFRRDKLEYKRLINPKFDNNSLSFDKYSGDLTLGTKVEVKNINSIKFAADAVDYEIKRQSNLLEAGEKIKQETRGWDEKKGETYLMRSKEEAQDYRYFPEPDLPPLSGLSTIVNRLLSEIPELPQQRRERFAKQYGLPEKYVEIFVVNKRLGDYYEHVASELDSAAKDYHKKKNLRGDFPNEPHLKEKLHTLSANYMITEFPTLTNSLEQEIEVEGFKISSEAFAELMVLIFHKELSSTGAKAVLKEMAETGSHPEQIMKEKDLGQVSDVGDLKIAVDKVITYNSKAVEDYKKGKEASLKFLVGMVMRESGGRANPQVVEQIIMRKLKI